MPTSMRRAGLRRPSAPSSLLVLVVVLMAGLLGLPPAGAVAGPLGPPGAAPPAHLAAAITAAPAYYRPVVAGGKTFPVARSNFLSLLEFPNNWHAPRMRLINGKWRLVGVHLGIDISAERGTPVLAMERGVVENVGWTFYSGTRVGVRGADGRYYLYAHLSTLEPRIVRGARVAAGSVLGRLGNTGYGPPGHRDEFPPHLHFGIEAGGEWVNPYPLLVRLYRATVEKTSRLQAVLDNLAAAGKRREWERRASSAYMSLRPPGGE